jgi:hypothetical protein
MTTLTQTPVQERAPKKRPSRAARRLGYTIAIVVNVLLIYAINEWPGWQQVTFLTDETTRVIPLVNAALVISIVANAIYLIADARWLRALGEAINAAVSFVVILVVFTVWPFDFTDWSFDWTMLVQILGVVGLVGSLVAVITNLVTFTREVGHA